MLARALPVLAVLLVGCARSEDASVTVDMNRIAPDIVLRNNAEEEIAVGTWREAAQDNSPALEFADATGQPGVSLRCAERGGLMLQRHGTSAAGGNPSIAINVGRERRDVPAQLMEGGLLRATLTSGDPLLAGASRERRENSDEVLRLGPSGQALHLRGKRLRIGLRLADLLRDRVGIVGKIYARVVGRI